VIPTHGMRPPVYSTAPRESAGIRVSALPSRGSRDPSPIRPSAAAPRARMREPRGMRTHARALAALVAVALALLPGADGLPEPGDELRGRWVWPGGVPEVVTPYEQPAHDYAPGHRGVDVAVRGSEVV